MSKIIKLGTYKNIEVKVPAAPVVTDQQVETEIEGMMANQTSLQDKEPRVIRSLKLSFM